jgi:apolipoprotein N-acyltransferase
VFIIAGLNEIEPHHNVNTAIVFTPLDYKILLEYDKRYPIPGLEANYRPGFAPRMFRFRQVDAGIQICKDMDFPSWSREYGKRNARVLFVPAWDFDEDGEFHARMAIVRGVENGFSVVRCAQQGLLTISDYTGRVVAEESSSSSPVVLLLGAVAPGPGNTFYVVAGDWFGWLNLIFVCVLIPSLAVYVSRRALKQFQAHS